MGVHYREEPCRSALNRVQGMPFSWSLNPYTGCVHRCTFCYVRAFELRAQRDHGESYGLSIRVKTNIAEVLRRELGRPSWRNEGVAIGSATDPYQPAEGRYRLTRACLQELCRAGTPTSLITRGPMIVRDIDVLQEVARYAPLQVTFSVPTVDPTLWKLTEPGTAPPHQRFRAIAKLVEAGIDVGVGMAPILPHLSDRPDLLAEVVRAAREAGATFIWTNVLYLKPGTKEHFMDHLAKDFPDLVEEYQQLYGSRSYAPREQTAAVRKQVALLRSRFGIADRRENPIQPQEQLTLL